VHVTILASGSSGNAALLSSARTGILIDAGLSKRETLKRLAAAGECADAITAILVSHEHADHAQGLLALAQEWNVPTFLTAGAYEALEWTKALPKVEKFRPGQRFAIGDIEITPFVSPHDSVQPVAFTFHAAGLKLAMATDIGCINDSVKQHVRGADCLVIESNHDLEMLRHGPYPWCVKQRLLSRLGHLSNLELARFLEEDFDGVARYLVLAHLSENNNYPELARMSAIEALARRQARFPLSLPRQPELLLTSQRTPLGPIRL